MQRSNTNLSLTYTLCTIQLLCRIAVVVHNHRVFETTLSFWRLRVLHKITQIKYYYDFQRVNLLQSRTSRLKFYEQFIF